jgi:hypothetical protein
MLTRCCLTFSVLVLNAAAFAEVPPQSKKDLERNASDVVIGRVQDIYSNVKRSKDWEKVRYVAEVRVEKVVKGTRVVEGQPAYARYWRDHWIGEGNAPPHAKGHKGAKVGDRVQLYLRYAGGNDGDGGFDVLLPNGFSVPGKTDASGPSELTLGPQRPVHSKLRGKLQVVAGGAVLQIPVIKIDGEQWLLVMPKDSGEKVRALLNQAVVVTGRAQIRSDEPQKDGTKRTNRYLHVETIAADSDE